MSEAWTLIKLLPVLLGLIKSIQKGIDDAKLNATVADHLAQVKVAFDTKNADALNAIFNG
jgi:hypothetical protein